MRKLWEFIRSMIAIMIIILESFMFCLPHSSTGGLELHGFFSIILCVVLIYVSIKVHREGAILAGLVLYFVTYYLKYGVDQGFKDVVSILFISAIGIFVVRKMFGFLRI